MNSILISSFFAAVLLFATTAPVADAQLTSGGAGGLIVNADQMSSDFKTKTTQLRGNIQIVFQGQHLSAERATIDYKNKRIEARGKVKLQSATVYAEASHLIVNYEADTAWMQDAFIQSGQVVFEGREIQKTGPQTYVATDAKYTACVSCPPTWDFSGKRIEAELGGYARITRPVMRVGGIPIIILPGILVPLKSARQSGMLVPSLDVTSKGGLAFSESFFWAMDRSHDMTFTGKYYELRGFKGEVEHRYVLTDTSHGRFAGGYLRDRAFKHDYGKVGITEDLDRWYLKYGHYYDLPDNFIQRVDIRQISDLRYLRDFPDEVEGQGSSAIENRVSLTKNFPGQHLSAEASYHHSLLKFYPLPNNDDAVHRFPEIRYSVTEKRVLGTPLLFSLDSIYTNFSRNHYSYDDLTVEHASPAADCPGGVARCADINSRGDVLRDGQFDSDYGGGMGDLIRTGQRLDFKPSLTLPFQVGGVFDIIPRLSYREMQYRFNLDEENQSDNFSNSAAQRYLETDVLVRSKISRVYGSLESPQSVRVKHELEPEVGFSNIPWVRRAEHGFFGEFAGQNYSRIFEPISDQDLYGRNKLQFDYNDRVFDKKLVNFGVTNRVTRKRWRAGIPTYERIGTFRVAQSYDIYEARTDRPQPWSALNALLNVRLDNFETYTTASHNGYAKVTNTSSRVRLFNRYGNFIQGSYERIYLINEENVVTSRNQTENLGFGAGVRTKYLDASGQMDYSAISHRVISWHYVADLKPPGDCWIIRIGHKQVIGGDPEFRFNMSFDFGGEDIKRFN